MCFDDLTERSRSLGVIEVLKIDVSIFSEVESGSKPYGVIWVLWVTSFLTRYVKVTWHKGQGHADCLKL